MITPDGVIHVAWWGMAICAALVPVAIVGLALEVRDRRRARRHRLAIQALDDAQAEAEEAIVELQRSGFRNISVGKGRRNSAKTVAAFNDIFKEQR